MLEPKYQLDIDKKLSPKQRLSSFWVYFETAHQTHVYAPAVDHKTPGLNPAIKKSFK